MKNCLFGLVVLMAFNAHAFTKEDYVDGLIITNTGDTVYCKIKIPYNLGKFNEMEFFSFVNILDKNNNKIKYKPKDIKGYSFNYNSKKYIYVSKVVDDDNTTIFVWPIQYGSHLNEYYYYQYNSTNLAKGSMGALDEKYILEDDAKQIVTITRGGSIINSYKSQLRSFFNNNKPMLQLITENVKEFSDITKFVEAANKLK